MLFGHLAISALEHRYLKAEFLPVMAAAMMPDAIDKVAHYALGQTAFGRLWAHTLAGVVVSSIIVFVVSGKRNAASWALGYLSHLIADLGGVVPWLYPWIAYEFPPSYGFETTLGLALANYPQLALETALTLWAFLSLRRRIKPTLRLWTDRLITPVQRS